jgi:hypothetical protein
MLCATIDTLAIARARANGVTDSLEAFMSERDKLWERLRKPAQQLITENRLHPMVVYTMSELARASSGSLGGVRYEASAGLLDVDAEGGVTGKSFTNLENRTRGLVTLYDFLAERHGTSVQIFLERISGILNDVGSAAEPFFRNYGSRSNQCYFVEGTALKGLDKLLKSDSLDLRRKGVNLATPFQFFGNAFYSLPDLAKRSEGLSIRDVSGVVDYAKHHSLSIAQERSEGVKFKYRDFVIALQQQRGNV